jgi:hypothetical protein
MGAPPNVSKLIGEPRPDPPPPPLPKFSFAKAFRGIREGFDNVPDSEVEREAVEHVRALKLERVLR